MSVCNRRKFKNWIPKSRYQAIEHLPYRRFLQLCSRHLVNNFTHIRTVYFFLKLSLTDAVESVNVQQLKFRQLMLNISSIQFQIITSLRKEALRKILTHSFQRESGHLGICRKREFKNSMHPVMELFIQYVRKIFRKTNFSYPLIRTCVRTK